MRKLSVAVAALATLALVAVDDAWSAGNRGGAKSGSAASGASRSGFGASRGFAFRRAMPPPSSGSMHFHHHGRAVIFIGAPFYYWSWPYGYYYAPPPYYYGPDYVAREELPPVYVEKFDGTPTPQTPGEIFCPGSDAFYPDAQQCPSGWQRIFREPPIEEYWDAG